MEATLLHWPAGTGKLSDTADCTCDVSSTSNATFFFFTPKIGFQVLSRSPHSPFFYFASKFVEGSFSR